MTDKDRIRILVVDDERPSRLRIRSLMKDHPEFRIVAECADGFSALDALRRMSVDVVLLDVQMPGMSGIELLHKCDPAKIPLVIFVTAHDQYALQAFDEAALDYLLKPYSRSRFFEALQRAKNRIRRGETHDQLDRLKGVLSGLTPKYPDRLLIKDGPKAFVVKTAGIDWIEAQDNYCCLHCGKEQVLVRDTMKNIESSLDPRIFVRIHRSTIVNVDRVSCLEPLFHKDHKVILSSGSELTLSRTYWERFQKVFAM